MRRLLGLLLLLCALVLLGGKAWLEYGPSYLEALPEYPFCQQARAALSVGRLQDAAELAEAGGDCGAELAEAQARWNSLGALFGRCVSGVWTGRADDGVGVGCAIASDLVLFGDVRDLTRQGVAAIRGDATDPVLIALSAAGLALALAPNVGAGASLLKGARRAGALSEPLTKAVLRQARQGSWRPLAGLLGDAGRMSIKLGPARATRVVAYADDGADLARLARFVDDVPRPWLGLKWGGKRVASLTDEALYGAALKRGPDGIRLALERGAKALLVRQPAIIFIGKSLYKHPEALVAALLKALDLVRWPLVGWLAGALAVVGLLLSRTKGRRRPRVRNGRPRGALP